MKTKNIYQGIALLAMALTTAACQNELNEDATQPQPGGKVNMTIRATQSTTPQTRISYEDKLGGTPFDGIVVKWEQGSNGESAEKIKVFDYSDNDNLLKTSKIINSKGNSLSSDGKSITFEGEVGNKGKYLAMYPADNCVYDEEDGVVYTSFLNQTQNCATPMKHLKDYDLMVGRPEEAEKYDKFTFTHEATMIRFILSLPATEIITKVSLSSNVSLYSRMYTSVVGQGAQVEVDNDPADATPIPSFDLAITGHTASATPLKAYMMMPPIDFSGATLTINVNTANTNGSSGSTYTGTITALASQKLEASKCYTLQPTLTTPTVTIPNVEEGKLQDKLDAISQDTEKTELVLQGAVNTTDVEYLVTFLNNKTNFTTLDLSGITIAGNSATVTGFEGTTAVTTVILPDNAEAIGEKAFKGCTALTTVTQNETPTRATTRASMPKKVKTVGASAFEGCTSMTEMFLHANINTIGNYAFKGCTAMTALVFEGTNAVGAGLTLGTDILAGCTQDGLNILLPAIKGTEATKAATYKKALGKPTYYEYKGDYGTATDADKVKFTSYNKSVPSGSGVGDIGPGGNWGK